MILKLIKAIIRDLLMLLLTAAGAVMVGVVVIGDAWNYAQQLEPNQYK